MKNIGSAVWQGGLKGGNGTVSTAGGALKGVSYSFARRFETADGPGTNPEELIASAHAACFAMATAAALERGGHAPTRLESKATVTMEPVDGKPTIKSSHLELVGTVPGLDAGTFLEIANGAKSGCVVSRALNCEITLDARLS